MPMTRFRRKPRASRRIVFALLLTTPASAWAQVCLGRPIAADARLSAGIEYASRERRTAIVPHVGARWKATFVSLGVGTQRELPRTTEWHAVAAFARAERPETRVAVCPVLRMAYRLGAHVLPHSGVVGADTTIEAGISVAGRIGTRGRLTIRGDVGVEHHIGRRHDDSAMGGPFVYHPVTGIGASANLARSLTLDASVRVFIEGAAELRYAIGLTKGWP